MNTKLTLAVLFALVSVSLCELPTPSKELKDKYEDYKTTFYRRLANAFQKMQGQAAPLADAVSADARVQAIKEFMETAQGRPEVQAAVKVAGNMGGEVGPLVEKARETLLGLYEHYLRAYIGESLDTGIKNMKPFLDSIMPAE
uniref:Apolipoprotein A-II n=1 Tax=Gouania willdenowi TaxID=441366 RepID=A0A8C5ELU9_GOUWI